jgi:hypothetical protein
VDEGWGCVKPGWARVNFNYFIDDIEAAFIMRAVLQVSWPGAVPPLPPNTHTLNCVVQVATHAWKLLPQYRLNPRTGQYTHCAFDKAANLRSIAEINIGPGARRCELNTHAILPRPVQ